MKTTIIKMLWRNILKTKSQFLSLIAISSIGVAMYVGVSSVPSTMQENAQKHFDNQLLSDIEMINPLGFTDEDIEKIDAELDDVSIEKSIVLDAIYKYDNQEEVGRIYSHEEFNIPYIVEGRTVQNENECLVDISNDNLLNKTLKLEANGVTKECKVVGTMLSPLHLSLDDKGFSELSNKPIQAIIYTKQSFVKKFYENIPYLEPYNSLSIMINSKPNNRTFQQDYQDYINDKENIISDLFNDDNITITTRHDNVMIDSFQSDSSKIREIAAIFPIIFFLVATLVASTTMSRIIEDERMQIGTLSALGYSRFAIISLYTWYTFLAVTIGIVIGLSVGFSVIPTTVTSAYSVLYILPEINIYFDYTIAIEAISSSIILIVGVTLLVALTITRASCATLLRPKSPLAGKKVFVEKILFIWNRLSFINKVSIRNILRYKKRLFMVVLAVMGCSGLLLTGLGIRTSVTPIVSEQFNNIFTYDISTYTTIFNSDEVSDKTKQIEEVENIESALATNFKNATVDKDNKEYNLTVVTPSDSDKINDFINFDTKFDEKAVIITSKIADIFNIKNGDTLDIIIDDDKYSFTITAITTNYAGNYLYINKDIHEEKFNAIEFNSFYIRSDGATDSAAKNLEEISFIKTITNNETTEETISESINGINELVYIIIAFAGLLVMVVMYCLSSINLIERKRELATLKVLGFYDNEVSSYVLKENISLTILGLIFGLIFGKYIHIYIMSQIETPDIQFIMVQPVLNYVVAFVITLVFSLSINIFMQRKIKDIDMVDSLKSIE